MSIFRTVPARLTAKLRSLLLIAGALFAGAAQAETVQATDTMDPPAIVIDAEFVPALAVGHVVYVAHEQEILAMDTASGAIRAVFPAPPRPTHAPTTGFAALSAASVSVPAFGIVLLAAAFLAMVGIIFLRRAPVSA